MNVNICHGKQRKILKLLVREYGDDAGLILNALHEMSARVAIAAGVAPDTYAQGVKHHWDFIANAINSTAESKAIPNA